MPARFGRGIEPDFICECEVKVEHYSEALSKFLAKFIALSFDDFFKEKFTAPILSSRPLAR